MKKTKRILLYLVVCCMMLYMVPSVLAYEFLNASFEDPVITGPWLLDTVPTGWQQTGGGKIPDIYRPGDANELYPVPDGAQALGITGGIEIFGTTDYTIAGGDTIRVRFDGARMADGGGAGCWLKFASAQGGLYNYLNGESSSPEIDPTFEWATYSYSMVVDESDPDIGTTLGVYLYCSTNMDGILLADNFCVELVKIVVTETGDLERIVQEVE